MSLRVLFVTPYPLQAADTRYRIGQYLAYLAGQGIEGHLRPFMSQRFYNTYHHREKLALNLFLMAASSARRLLDTFRSTRYDVVFVHKEAFPFGPPVLERAMKRAVGRLIYDMDDAFWTHPPQLNQIGRRLRDPNRTAKILAMSDCVLAGNHYLASYAQQFGPEVTVLPTAIDLERYTLRPTREAGTVTVGWVGRWSSADYLRPLEPVFQRLAAEFPQLDFLFIGAPDLGLDMERVTYRPWRLESEIADLHALDVGIMPLPDDDYSRGKCGFKMLQYMGAGIPTVVSPVGINGEVVRDGINGFTADSQAEWVEKLSALIRDPALRRTIGLAGRETVKCEYATAVTAPRLLNTLTRVAAQPANRRGL